MPNRYHPDVIYTRYSPNRRAGRTSKPKIIVVHSTEGHNRPGNTDLIGVTDYLCRPATQASAHVCTDADGHSSRMVSDGDTAWHVAGYNPVALGIEQVGVAATENWLRDEYRETARWIARWSLRYGIPVRPGKVARGYVLRSGVVRHSDLGALGGGHVDPGPHYKLDDVLSLARFYRGKI